MRPASLPTGVALQRSSSEHRRHSRTRRKRDSQVHPDDTRCDGTIDESNPADIHLPSPRSCQDYMAGLVRPGRGGHFLVWRGDRTVEGDRAVRRRLSPLLTTSVNRRCRNFAPFIRLFSCGEGLGFYRQRHFARRKPNEYQISALQ